MSMVKQITNEIVIESANEIYQLVFLKEDVFNRSMKRVMVGSFSRAPCSLP